MTTRALSLLGLLGSLAACSAATGGASAPEQPAPPNIVFFLADDLGYGEVGSFGSELIPTPHIDSIARDGVRFTQGYVSASVCCPSRAGLLTGRYQQRFGHEFNGFAIPQPGFTPEDMGLDPDETTLAEALKPLGYRTMIVGKWHMGTHERFHPKHHGFDEFFGIKGGSRSYFGVPRKRVSENWKLYRNEEVVPESEISYLTDMLTDEAVAYVERNRGRPFFLYLSYTAVHGPMHGKAEDIEHFNAIADKKRRTFAAMDKALDDGVGRLLATLKANGLDDNTLLFFINDNGGAINNGSDNGPWRGMKSDSFEGGHRMPFVVRWPGRARPGTQSARTICFPDVFATCVEAAGGQVEEGAAEDSVSFLPALSGKEIVSTRNGVIHHSFSGHFAYRHGQWKLLLARASGGWTSPKENQAAAGSPPAQLYDLKTDPYQARNVHNERPEVVAELSSLLEKWKNILFENPKI